MNAPNIDPICVGREGAAHCARGGRAPLQLNGYRLEIRVRVFEVQFLDPGVAVAYIMAFALELQAARLVGNALASVVASVHARVRAAPDLVDRLVGVNLDAVEMHCE